MNQPNQTPIRIPKSALEEFEDLENDDWADGISLPALISWINMVEDIYRPDDLDARSSKNFTERSFRHYQTLGCIDAPRRVGKEARYGFRQYLQALLIRKLLWERVPSEQIATLMKDKSNEEYKVMLFEGVEIVSRQAPEGNIPEVQSETWKRHTVGPGIELHVNAGRKGLSRSELQMALSEMERILSTK